MSVYSIFSESQLDVLSEAIGGEISDLKGIEAGISNTIYEATLTTPKAQDRVVVIIHETPDRIAHGTPAEQSKYIPELMFYAANNIGTDLIKDDQEMPVPIRIPLPYLWNASDTSGMMQFQHAKGFGMVNKTVSVLPFADGKVLDWSIGQCQPLDIIRQAGQGLAVFHTASKGFPFAEEMPNPYGFDKWILSIETLRGDPDAELDLSRFLAKKESSYRGREVLRLLSEEANFIENNWDKRTSDLPMNMTHGDYFPDNIIANPTGKHIILDFGNSAFEVEAYDIALSINAWASENGILIPENVNAFLEGYNSVKPLEAGIIQELPFLGRAASFGRALLRIDIALNTPDPDHANSPEDCLIQLEHWQMVDKTSYKFNHGGERPFDQLEII